MAEVLTKTPIPPEVEARVKRAGEQIRDGSAKRNECLKFWRSEQYAYVDGKNALRSQATTTNYGERTGKPAYRQRRVRNLIFDIVEREVSASTSRIPSYEVAPSTSDSEDVGGARLAEKVALYGYDQWNIRRATEKVVRHAVVADEGFAWPYFDNSIGPYADSEDGSVGMGDIRIRVFGANEVGWERGVDFEESPYHVVQQARDIQSVLSLDGYIGGKLTPDAQVGDNDQTSSDRGGSELVLVTDYLERPTPKNPTGRWITLANGRVIVPERNYPCADEKGEPLDEPILHKLTYAVDPDADRDMGLVRHLLDAQRTINMSVSKSIEWMVLALNPQLVIQNGALADGQVMTDQPGAVYNVHGTGQVQWRPVPQIPSEIFTIKSQAEQDMARISAQNDIPGNVESGKGIQALIEKDQSRRQNFIANLAEFHSRLMRHCLYLVQRHYTDERMLMVVGDFGPDPLQDFRGAKLRGQMDVRVSAGSIEPQTKEWLEQKVMNFAQLGWITPEQAMAAINSGSADALIKDYEYDKARANLIIRKIKDGSFLQAGERPVMPSEDAGPQLDEMGMPIPVMGPDGPVMTPGEVDPMTGMEGEPQPQYVQATTVPAWLPRPFDKIRVHKTQFETWMKSADWDRLDPPSMEAANQYYDALLRLEAKQQADQQQAQDQAAQQMGDFNASKPQQASPLPSLPSGMNGNAPQQ